MGKRIFPIGRKKKEGGMIFEVISAGLIGAAYITGDEKRKEDMRCIGRKAISVAKDVARDTAKKTKATVEKLRKQS